jgi:hypothetical protein
MRTSCLRAAAFWVAAFTGVIGAREGATFGADRNACGCYQTDGGSCYCDKKSKCGCPGECEPKGCEEKRQKEMDKEIHAETKRAQDSARTHAGNDHSEGTVAKSTSAPDKESSAAKPLTPAQLHELGRLLDLYVRAHPDDGSKGIEQLVRELTHSPR